MNKPTQKLPEAGTDVWPEEIRLAKSKDQLDVRFENGARFTISAELLRVESPSAEVQGHGLARKPHQLVNRYLYSVEAVVIMLSVLVSMMGIIPAFSAGQLCMITVSATMN